MTRAIYGSSSSGIWIGRKPLRDADAIRSGHRLLLFGTLYPGKGLTPLARQPAPQLSMTNPDYPKYPPQPIVRCEGFKRKEEVTDEVEL